MRSFKEIIEDEILMANAMRIKNYIETEFFEIESPSVAVPVFGLFTLDGIALESLPSSNGRKFGVQIGTPYGALRCSGTWKRNRPIFRFPTANREIFSFPTEEMIRTLGMEKAETFGHVYSLARCPDGTSLMETVVAMDRRKSPWTEAALPNVFEAIKLANESEVEPGRLEEILSVSDWNDASTIRKIGDCCRLARWEKMRVRLIEIFSM